MLGAPLESTNMISSINIEVAIPIPPIVSNEKNILSEMCRLADGTREMKQIIQKVILSNTSILVNSMDTNVKLTS